MEPNMTPFTYSALDRHAHRVEGVVSARDRDEALAMLRIRGLFATSVEAAPGAAVDGDAEGITPVPLDACSSMDRGPSLDVDVRGPTHARPRATALPRAHRATEQGERLLRVLHWSLSQGAEATRALAAVGWKKKGANSAGALMQAIAEEWRSGEDVLSSIGRRQRVFGDVACQSIAVGLPTHGPATAVHNYLDFRSREQRLSLPGRRHRFSKHGRRFALAMLHALEQGLDIRSAIELAGLERNWAWRRYCVRAIDSVYQGENPFERPSTIERLFGVDPDLTALLWAGFEMSSLEESLVLCVDL